MKLSFGSNPDSNDFFSNKQLSEKVYFLLLGLVLVFIAFIRIRLIDFPLERDEGEYAYMGQLMLDGIPPYKFAYNMKLPGTYGMYALFMGLFGETTRGIHTGFIILNITTILILFFFVRKLFNSSTALISSAAYGVYALNPYILGFAAHATHFLLLFAVSACYFLLSAKEQKGSLPYFFIGFLFGMSFLMKQQAIFLILFSGIYFLFLNYLSWKEGNFELFSFFQKGLMLVIGTILPFLITVFILYIWGVFPSFWYWTFQYASKYAGMSTLSEGLINLKSVFKLLTYGYQILWILTAIGFIIYLILSHPIYKKVYLYLLVFFSFLTTTPGLYFREHYFIGFIPFAFIFFGISMEFIRIQVFNKIERMNQKHTKWTLYSSFIIICILFLVIFKFKAHKDYYFKETPLRLSRQIYGVNPFQEAIQISKYIKENTKEEDQIIVLGSEPEIYFYSNRKSATGYIYMYPLMEIHPYSKEIQIRKTKK